MRTPVDLIVTAAALKVVSGIGFHRSTDMVLDQNPEVKEFKNVCAKVHISLSDRIDEIVDVLGISKRAFLEAAMLEACDKAQSIISTEGVIEHLSLLHAAEGQGSFVVEE